MKYLTLRCGMVGPIVDTFGTLADLVCMLNIITRNGGTTATIWVRKGGRWVEYSTWYMGGAR